MQTYLTILRGINVSGQKMIKMPELKKMYEELNFKNPRTYIQSGNVVFESNAKADGLSELVEKKIFETFEFKVPVIIRTVDEMKNLIGKNPFLKEKDIELDKLHITFLSEEPGKENINKITALDFSPDRFIILNKEIYIYCPNGYGRTKLTNNFFENKLKVTATTRNWKTVNELFKIMSS